jgi:hypothetical protein
VGTIDAEIQRAIELLARVAAERVMRHPQGHLLRPREGHRSYLDLTLRLALDGGDDELDTTAAQVTDRLDQELAALLAHHAALRPGHIYCHRCQTADCAHSRPSGPRQVFTGYASTGAPRFEDFAQWLLACQDGRAAVLYGERAADQGFVTQLSSGKELTTDLVAAFEDRQGPDIRIHGQVAAGWFPLRAKAQQGRELALTLQVVSSRKPGKGTRRRLSLNIIGAGNDGAPLSALEDRLEQMPWMAAAKWAQAILGSIERAQARHNSAHLQARIEGVLGAVAGRLEQSRRGTTRRTKHAEDRHQGGDRPTRLAVAALQQVADDRILHDTLRNTLIVLGARGRAHVFAPAGKHVTSIRYSPEAIERKKSAGRWRRAEPAAIERLRGAHDATVERSLEDPK